MEAVPRQIVWRCRRGTRELDLVLGKFLQQGYIDLDPCGRALFEEMLALQDTVLIEWLLYHQAPDERFGTVVKRILGCQPGG